jgi:hypothetical protein
MQNISLNLSTSRFDDQLPDGFMSPGWSHVFPPPTGDAGDAAMKLCRDQARLLPHDRELFPEAREKVVDLIRWHQKRAHQNDWADVALELLLERDAIVEVDYFGSLARGWSALGGGRNDLKNRSKPSPDRSGPDKVAAR